MSYQATDKFVFPKWANYLLPLIVVSALGGAAVVPPIVLYGASAETQNVGYQPDQPVPYSHELHVGQLGIDLRDPEFWDRGLDAIAALVSEAEDLAESVSR